MKKQLFILGMLTLTVAQLSAVIISGPACYCQKKYGESSASVQKRNQTVRNCLNKYGYGQLKKCCQQGRCTYTNN